MKNLNRKTFVIIICFCTILNLSAQNEKLSIDIETQYDTTPVFLTKSLKPFSIKLTDETWNIKLGVSYDPSDYFKFIRPNLFLGVEKRVKKFSFGLNSSFTFVRFEKYPYESSSDKKFIYFIHLNPEIRYYHNLNKRISLGKTGNNFSANYFTISANYILHTNYFEYLDYRGINYSSKSANWNFTNGYWQIIERNEKYKRSNYYNYIKLGYGIQRKFNNNLFFDIQGGVTLFSGYSLFFPFIDLKVGYSF